MDHGVLSSESQKKPESRKFSFRLLPCHGSMIPIVGLQKIRSWSSWHDVVLLALMARYITSNLVLTDLHQVLWKYERFEWCWKKYEAQIWLEHQPGLYNSFRAAKYFSILWDPVPRGRTNLSNLTSFASKRPASFLVVSFFGHLACLLKTLLVVSENCWNIWFDEYLFVHI